MALHFERKEWTTKPPAGTSLRKDGHWSTQGLVGCWSLNEGAGTRAVNLVSGVLSTAVNGAVINADGAVFSASSNQCFKDDNTPIITGNKFTVFTVAVISSQGTLSSAVCGTRETVSSPNKGFSLKVEQYNATGKIGITFGNVSDYLFNSIATPADGVRFSLSVVVNGSNATANLNGRQSETISVGQMQPTSTKGFVIGAWAPRATNSVGDPFDGKVSVTYLYNRALSASEIASLHVNPYQMFQPMLVPVVFSAAGGTTAVYSDLTLRWDCLNIINSDSSLRYDILNTISSDSTLKFDINNIITSDSSLRWDMAGTVSSDLTTRFDILNQIASDLGLRFDILQGVSSDLILKFDLNNMVQSDITALWKMAGGVWSDCTVRYAINQDAGVGYFIIQTDSDKHAKYNRHKNYKRRYKVI